MTSLKTSIKTITYLSDTGCLEIQGASLGFIIPSDGRKEVQVHISAFTPRDAEVLIPGLRVEFCRVNGLRGPTAANVYLS